MPDLFKPLFNPNLLKSRAAHFAPGFSAAQTQVVENWARTAADPAFRAEREKPFQGQFLTDLCGGLLGYVLPAGHLDAYNLKAESASSETKGGKTPDALLEDSTHREQQITREFYALFSQVRLQLFQHLCAANPAHRGCPLADTRGSEVALADPSEPSRDREGVDLAAHQVRLLAQAQKILDRLLFICFCEDTGLLPHGIIRQAFSAAGSGFVATSRWQQLCGLFQAVDKGSPPLKISGYNGGLFRADPELEALRVADAVLDGCLRLSEYDFATDVDVNILGHISEQSVTDLEALRAGIQGQKVDETKSTRKLSGIFYTPEFITQYIVAETVGTCLRERFAELQARHEPEAARGPARQQAARIALWEGYQDVLRHLRVLDLACGSGAFLIAACDFLHAEYVRTNERPARLRLANAVPRRQRRRRLRLRHRQSALHPPGVANVPARPPSSVSSAAMPAPRTPTSTSSSAAWRCCAPAAGSASSPRGPSPMRTSPRPSAPGCRPWRATAAW